MNTSAPTAIATAVSAADDLVESAPAFHSDDVFEVAAALDALGSQLSGTVNVPGDPDWDEARQAWNLAAEQNPVAVVRALSVSDIILTVNAARELGLRVAPQGTGHNATAMGDLDGTILLRTSAMRNVRVIPEARIARAEAGALWMDVTSKAAEFGLAALAGSSPDVGIAGYCLGGGASWLARSHGLAVNQVTAIEIVTADGLHRRIDTEHEPELFWAVRGGSGNYGIVTAIEMRLFPITEVYSGILFFPVDRAVEVLGAWRRWVDTVPESVTSVGRILKFPPFEEVPEPLRGQAFVLVEAVIQHMPPEADRLLAPLRELGPVMDTFHPTPVRELDQLHMDPEGPVPSGGDGFMLDDLDEAGIEAFVGAIVPDPALMMGEIRHLGGAAGRRAPNGGVVSHFDAPFLAFSGGMVMGPEVAAAIHAGLANLKAAMTRLTSDRMYQNFAEDRIDARAIWGDDVDRMRAVKVVYDPENVIRSNHPVL